MLSYMGFKSIDDFYCYLKSILDKREDFTEEEVLEYTKQMMTVKNKIATFPDNISEKDIYNIFYNSLMH